MLETYSWQHKPTEIRECVGTYRIETRILVFLRKIIQNLCQVRPFHGLSEALQRLNLPLLQLIP
jgi:hypothetical protein